MSNRMMNDDDCISQWREIIGRFNSLIKNEPAPDKVKKDLLALKAEASSKSALTCRQTEAIASRVDNYIAGKYGNTKTAYNMSHSKL